MAKLQTILSTLAAAVAPGVTTKSLDELAERLCKEQGVDAAFKGYKPPNFGKKNEESGEVEGFPASICVSIDNEVIHGIPRDRKIEEGQVVKIDFGTHEQITNADGHEVNYYDDGATTVLVGHCSSTARRLVKATEEALEAGVSAAKAGNTTHDIAKAIEAVAKKYEVFVVHGYGGHGIGTELHMEPHIPNEIDGSAAVTLIAGDRIAIEPMFGTNHGFTEVAKDGWTVKLLRGGLASHFERTITIE
jgi:methionyl aminopeptidase